MTRVADHQINPVFLERWSSRAFSDEAISSTELMRLFEAARWAPSAFNAQPWRFVYALRDDAAWARFTGALAPFNTMWAGKAAALLFVLSKKADAAAPHSSHSFDAGAAWAFLALQAHELAWVAHAMTGVNFEAARETLNVPADHAIEAAIAIGKRGLKENLPDMLQARETPNGRNPVSSFVFAHHFPPQE